MVAAGLIGATTAVQDFQNKSLAPLQRGTAGGSIAAEGLVKPGIGPSLPTTSGGGGMFADRLQETAQAASGANQRLMNSIQQRKARERAQQGRGSFGGATQAMSGAGLGSAGGWGGAYGLQKNAATALSRLSAAYQARWGSPLVVNSGGRSYEEQARAYALYRAGKGNLAAPPGTSVHETGRAVDLGGPITWVSPQHRWLQSVASQYGFSWTGRNFSQVEPWHWEYVGS